MISIRGILLSALSACWLAASINAFTVGTKAVVGVQRPRQLQPPRAPCTVLRSDFSLVASTISPVKTALPLFPIPFIFGKSAIPTVLTQDAGIRALSPSLRFVKYAGLLNAVTFLLVSAFGRYQTLLTTYPAVTKSVTASCVSFFGDVLAQAAERSLHKTNTPYNFRRSLTVAAEGLCIAGPILHFSYDRMENMIVGFALGSRWLESVAQVLLDIFVLDSLLTGTLMITSGFLQGRRQHIVHQLRTEYIPAVKVAWLSSLSMAPLQFLNFNYIPLQFRVLVTNFQDVAWNAAVSHMAHRSRK